MTGLSVIRLVLSSMVLGGLAACASGSPPPPASPAASARGPSTPAPAPSASTATPSQAPTASPSHSPAPSKTPSAASTARPVIGALAGKDWTYIPTTQRVVALTFDAGANADAVPSILRTLARTHIPATFFLTGDFVRDYPAAARQIAQGGYRIGDHTITHPHLTRLSDAAVRQEITGAAQQITAVTGQNLGPLFRFPFGDADVRVIAIANSAGYIAVRWTVDTLGWEGRAGNITTDVVISRVLASLRPGEIVLMHVGSNPDDHSTLDADALPEMISLLKARGYSFVTLDAFAPGT
jgi:peptidoglycan/xylan/chitin deacetylase (PgdA/CDA1 family)